nr:reverse transcriptase domain-containing protein [Tanacetum cinerariifolium]
MNTSSGSLVWIRHIHGNGYGVLEASEDDDGVLDKLSLKLSDSGSINTPSFTAIQVLRLSPSAKVQAIILDGRSERDKRPRDTPPLTKEQIKGHVSALKSLIKSHNQKNKGDPIRLDFKTKDAEAHDYNIIKGKEVIYEDLRKPFKEAQRTPLTRRIIEFAGLEYKMPNNIKLYDGTTEDHLSRFASATNSEEWLMPMWCRMFQQTLDESVRGWFERLPHDNINEWAKLSEAFAARFSVRRGCFNKPHKITKIIRKANESLTAFKERWTLETGFIMGVPEVMEISSFMDSVKSTELAKRFLDKVPTMAHGKRYISCEQAKGRQSPVSSSDGRVQPESHTGEGSLYKRLYPAEEAVKRALESGKLNHIAKDIQRGRKGPPGREDPQPAKIINVISVNSVKDKKRKVREMTEAWMNVPITFLVIPARDIFEEPLIVEAEVEGYLVKRVYVGEGLLVKVMFEHNFKNFNPRIKVGLRETQTDLVGFAGEISKPLGKIELKVYFDNGGLRKRVAMKFIMAGRLDFLIPNRKEIEGICGRHGNQEQGRGDVKESERTQKDKGFGRPPVSTNVERNAKPEWKTGCPQSVLANFLSEAPKREKEESYFRMPEVTLEKDDTKSWTLFTDGASSPKGSGAGLVLIGPSGIEYTYALCLTFLSTNNEAEYEALPAGLRIAYQMNISNIEVKVDSKLVASQINGSYKASKDNMIKYLAKAKEYAS